MKATYTIKARIRNGQTNYERIFKGTATIDGNPAMPMHVIASSILSGILRDAAEKTEPDRIQLTISFKA